MNWNWTKLKMIWQVRIGSTHIPIPISNQNRKYPSSTQDEKDGSDVWWCGESGCYDSV